MTRLRMPSRRVRPLGFTLIEVLVVILVLTFGLLGIAALQANTAKYKVNSWARSAASVQFGDLADRIRGNPAQAGGRFNPSTGLVTAASAYTYTASWEAQTEDPPAQAIDCLAAACTAAQRAAFDVLAFRREVRRQFPQGSVTLTGDVGQGGMRATIAWFDRNLTTLDGTLQAPTVCPVPVAGTQAASCCPATLAAPAGVRCTNVTFVP